MTARSQHPAAKAGRLVRAVGLGLARELEKLEKLADAPPKERPAPPPPPPPLPTRDLFGRAVFATWVVSLAALLLVLLHAQKTIGSHEAKLVFESVLTAVLFAGALVFLTNWRRANLRLVQRVLTRAWGPRGPANRRERAFARILRDLVTLAGIALLAGAVFELLVALGWSDATTVGV